MGVPVLHRAPVVLSRQIHPRPAGQDPSEPVGGVDQGAGQIQVPVLHRLRPSTSTKVQKSDEARCHKHSHLNRGLDKVCQQLKAPAEVLWISCGQQARDEEETKIDYPAFPVQTKLGTIDLRGNAERDWSPGCLTKVDLLTILKKVQQERYLVLQISQQCISL